MALSPMMQQYLQTKEENPGCIVFFRLGDFYEMFFDDAKLVSKELELTLTGKECGLEERAPMCGVPYHAVDTYVAKLVERGYRIAICEQMTDPALSKGLVERAVTRIVTPGTVIDAGLLDEKRANYILSVAKSKEHYGLAFCDLSTGELNVYKINGASLNIGDEIHRIAPHEILISEETILPAVEGTITKYNAAAFQFKIASKQILSHFSVKTLGELGLEEEKLEVCAIGALLAYLRETQRNGLSHIVSIMQYATDQYMHIDSSAMANLELTESLHTHARRGSLLGALDRTVTSMGSRQLRAWIEQPLQSKDAIENRLNAVESLLRDPFRADSLRFLLESVSDIERLLSKIAYESVNPRDCLALQRSLNAVPEILSYLSGIDDPLIRDYTDMIDPMAELRELLENAISPDAPLSVKDGGVFKKGYNEELDVFRSASTDGKKWLSDLEAREKEATGIKTLKVGFNQVFGYYLEVSKSFYDLVPDRYVRKQTLANCERFLTDELKKLEKTILGAEENAIKLETAMFAEIRDTLKNALPRLQPLATGLKAIDALLSLAKLAGEEGYSRPTINAEHRLDIVNGRHPMVEQSIGHEHFVPNDTDMDVDKRMMIITGPNMAGKSTYMRQVALIVLMAHAGSFVPADSADIPLTDRIFTRIGASDDLYGGQSTFMVEMKELATILRYATPNSLIILDEIGRGTSTFDGLSIAWATVEHITSKTHALTLFATHYHELSELEGALEGVTNYRITAKEQGDQVIFLRKIVKGSADKSYGVAVASLAGLPASLTSRARQIMARLEVDDEMQGSMGKSILDKRKNAGNRQIGMVDFEPMELVEEMRDLDVMSMSPIDALNKLFTLCEKARRI